jgi:PAS domain S-box-containing protein
MHEASPEARAPKQWLIEIFASVLPPLVVLLILIALQDFLNPHVWFLFYPAIMLSSWLGGWRSAIIATAFSALLVWVFLIPADPRRMFPTAVFVSTNVAIAFIHHRLRKTAVVLQQSLQQHNRELNRVNDSMTRLFDQAPDGIFIADLDGRYVSVNSAACRMLGYNCDELIGMRITDLIPPEEAPRLERTKVKLLKGDIELGEWTLRRRDGTRLPVEVSSSILPDGQWQALVRDITDRKLAENALRKSKAIFSGILAISADAIISVDEQQRITMFNEGAEKIFGYTKAEALGAPIDMLIPERLRTQHRKDVEHFMSGEQAARRMGPLEKDISGLRKNGEEFPADATISKLAVGGNIILTIALRDITEQVQAREQIRQSEERFELALRGADLGAWDWNIKTGEVIFNSNWAEMRGYRLNEIKCHISTWFSGVHPDDKPRVQKAFHDHFQGLTPEYEVEYRVRTKSGDWIWILDHGKVFSHDEQGHPLRMLGTEFNITERKRAEEELSFLAEVGPVMAASLDYEETLARLAQLAVQDLADFCIVDIVGDDKTVRRLKVACRDVSKNWICEELMRMPQAQTPPLTMKVIQSRQSVLMEHVSFEDLASHALSEEHLRLLRASDIHSVIAVPLLVREKCLGVIALISSPSSGTFGRADLRLAEELARRAALSIENARLYRAAGRAIQARDDVLGIVAHDLRNPLGVILTQAGLIERRGPEPERRRRAPIEAIYRSASRMNRLIQDLLDVSGIESGSLAIEPERIAVGQVLADALENLKSLAERANVELRVDLPHDLPDVWADRSRLLQILENLIGNAVKFSKPGGHITVGATLRENEIVFWIKDNGIGISADHLPHIFDRFWHAKQSDGGGAGLGLSIVKGLVEAHKGRIWADSTLDCGSTFSFTLPTVKAEQFASSEAR